jgi:hypothetical protein
LLQDRQFVDRQSLYELVEVGVRLRKCFLVSFVGLDMQLPFLWGLVFCECHAD